MKPRGRFVAGASCPACGVVDRVKVDVDTGLRRWCVECDFDEILDAEGHLPGVVADEPATVVRILGQDLDGSTRETK